MLIKVPVSWLREYVDITVPIDELALKLHMSSTEVKGIERPWWDDKIRTARVEKLAKHPNADKLPSRPSTTARALRRRSSPARQI